ncbi:MAG: adenine phosphoribosyltransferase [Ignavibacteriales bacterium]|nr:MAG: adenine phosphoribosyltransferase [Ignavibacteriales bacterium]
MKEELKKYIRSIKDFPKQGIMFRDITTLLKDPAALKLTTGLLFEMTKNLGITKVAAIESRGFIFGALLAEKLNAGFVPLRKPGKLPSQKISESYQLEYGNDSIEMHVDAINENDKVLIHDDLLATGGTAAAACSLVEKAGGKIMQVSFVIELSFLNGRKKLGKYDVVSLIDYADEN